METVYITRTINGKEEHIELTKDERVECLGVERRNFYRDKLQQHYSEVQENEIENIVWDADELYCSGDGYSEYEALEEILAKWGY